MAMGKLTNRMALYAGALIGASVAGALFPQATLWAQAPTTFPAGDGQAKAQAACAACHPVAIVAGKRYDAQKWGAVVDQMIDKGAKVSDADYDIIVTYLAKTYGPAN